MGNGTLVAGMDIGAATAKAVVLRDGEILGFHVVPTGYDIVAAGRTAITEVLKNSSIDIPPENLDFIVTTGYGRTAIPYAGKNVTELMCHARGAHHLIPETRFIIDIGGQDSKAIDVTPKGTIADFVMNDKCAAGSGRFLEVMANILQLPSMDDMGPISLQSEQPCSISNICTVFAETEVVVQRAQGAKREDLIAGVQEALAYRIFIMAQIMRKEQPAVFSGGVGKNIGMKKCLEQRFGFEFIVPDNPQIIGALGAALFAYDEVRK